MNLKIFNETIQNPVFPTTRYQGSKNKIIDWISLVLTEQNLSYETVLDGFGGSGAVSYMFKKMGKSVTYNDALKFNSIIGKALIENSDTTIDSNDLKYILTKNKNINYPTFIFDNFHDVYYTDEENKWLDIIITNIRSIKNEKKQAIAYFALFQSCIIKRPYNLFHRKNLYVRTQEVTRTFGNKKTWDTPFEEHFKKFIYEANNAIFSNKKSNNSLNMDIMNINEKFDLVYIDSPYISAKGIGVDYLDFYHFLEGIVDYDNWVNRIEEKTKHKRLKRYEHVSQWSKKYIITKSFEELFEKFKDSILVVSYREDGIPSLQELENLMKKYKKEIIEIKSIEYKYALSSKKTSEILIIGK
ncbi:DNA adenine methylase [Cetobacterium sp. SF1]|uniref:DNA adenine methylase n=1 Tax=Cetobacterium sp. SF1 TaxID=3417654 RepID=UPI003CF06F02